MKRFITAFVVVLALCGSLIADTATDATYLTGFGARQRGMGEAFVAMRGEPLGAFDNPAGLASLSQWYLGGGYSRFSGNTHGGTISLTGPLLGSRTVMAVSGIWDRTFDIANPFDHFISTFDGMIALGQVSIAHRFPLGMAIGGNAKISYLDDAGSSDYGCTVDFGVHYPVAPRWTLGVAFRDIIELAKLEPEGVGEFQLITGVFGLSYSNPDFKPDWGLVVNTDIRAVEDHSVKPLIGVEAYRELTIPATTVPATLSLRTGYNGDGLAAGAGLKWNGVSVDYAIACNPDVEELDAVLHSISLTVRLKDLIPSTGSNPDLVRARYRRDRYGFLMDVGNSSRSLRVPDYDRALEAYRQAVAFADINSTEFTIADNLADSMASIIDSQQRAEFDSQIASLREQFNAILTDSVYRVEGDLKGTLAQMRDSIKVQRGKRLEQIISNVEFAEELFRNSQYDFSNQLLDSSVIFLNALREESDSPLLFETTEQLIGDLRNSLRNGLARERDRRMLAAARALQSDSLIQAWEHYTIVLDLTEGSDYPPAVEGRNQVLRRLYYREYGRYPDSSLTVNTVSLSTEEVNRLYQEGMNYNRDGDYLKAIEVWEKVLAANPSHPSVEEDIATARARLESQQ